MKEKPILFNGQMVRAILEGRKTQTRRMMKPQPVLNGNFWHFKDCQWADGGLGFPKSGIEDHAPYRPGDRLWVRETWAAPHKFDHLSPRLVPANANFHYLATEERGGLRWRPNIHMPRAASRIALEVTDVLVERVQDISEEDVLAEGLWRCHCGCGTWSGHGGMYNRTDAVSAYKTLWEGIYGPGSWEMNPWVWVFCFRVLEVKR